DLTRLTRAMADDVQQQVEVLLRHLAVEHHLVFDVRAAAGEQRLRLAAVHDNGRTTLQRRARREPVFLENVIDVFRRNASFDGRITNVAGLESLSTTSVARCIATTRNGRRTKLDARPCLQVRRAAENRLCFRVGDESRIRESRWRRGNRAELGGDDWLDRG